MVINRKFVDTEQGRSVYEYSIEGLSETEFLALRSLLAFGSTFRNVDDKVRSGIHNLAVKIVNGWGSHRTQS